MIYFDNAATGGYKPKSVVSAVDYCLRHYNANPGRSGHTMSLRAAEGVYSTRKTVADFFGAKAPENVVFTLNCTQAINFVIKGVLKPGDHVIISDLEHNSVVRPIYKEKLDFSVAEVSLDDDEQTVENFKNLIKKNTKMIFCTAASNVCGKVLPLKQIGELCKRHNLYFAVDAAQAAGIIPINMQEMNIDYLCIAPHKGLFSPMGLGVLIAQKPIENTIIEGGTGSNSLEFSQPQFLPERLESGTVNLSGIYGLKAGIEFAERMGIDRIHRKEQGLIQAFFNFAKKDESIVLYTPYPTVNSYVPVLSFNVKGVTSVETADFLNQKGIMVRSGIHCAPLAHKKFSTEDIGTVRISVGFNNSLVEIYRLIDTLKVNKKVTKYFI